MAAAAVALAAPASAGARDKNCCFAVSVGVSGGYSVQYGTNSEHSRTGDYFVSWVWAARELASYKSGRLGNLGSRVTVQYAESSNISQLSLGPHGSSDATQEPVPCDKAQSFNTPGAYFIDSTASQLSLGETPAGKPAITVGLDSPYEQVGPNCPTGEEGDHADKFNLNPWSYTIPGPATKFLRIANQGDTFTPPDFDRGTLTYSHPYGSPSGASPHAFTGTEAVSLRIVYFPKSKLRARKKQLKQCSNPTSCRPHFPNHGNLLQDLNGVPDAHM